MKVFTEERLNFARSKWEHRHGNYLLMPQGQNMRNGSAITEDEARKIFKFIDYNEARVVSKH